MKTGTIFEDSPIAFEEWLPATWMLASCKNGVACELHRTLGVTLSGEVEVDNTFIGGKARKMRKDKKAEKGYRHGQEGKITVPAVLGRGGNVRAKIIDRRRKHQLHEVMRSIIGRRLTYQQLIGKAGREANG